MLGVNTTEVLKITTGLNVRLFTGSKLGFGGLPNVRFDDSFDGDDVNIYSPGADGVRYIIRHGTAGTPVTANAPTMKLSRTVGQSSANSFDPWGTTLYVAAKGLAGNTQQVTAITGTANTNSNIDAVGLFGYGRNDGSGSGIGTGLYAQGHFVNVGGFAIGAEIRCSDDAAASNHIDFTGGFPKAMGLWITHTSFNSNRAAAGAVIGYNGGSGGTIPFEQGFCVQDGSVVNHSALSGGRVSAAFRHEGNTYSTPSHGLYLDGAYGLSAIRLSGNNNSTDSTIIWGSGATAPKLYRVADNTLRFDITAAGTTPITGIGVNSTQGQTGSTTLSALGWFLAIQINGPFMQFSKTAATNTLFEAFISSDHTNAAFRMRPDGLIWGAGTATALDTRLQRTAAATLSLDNNSTGAATFRLPNAASIISFVAGGSITADATNGLKIGASADKISFFSVTPVVRAAALTQTYSTATRTHSNLTSATLTDNTAGTANTTLEALGGVTYAADVPGIRNNFADLAASDNAIIADLTNLKQFVNAIADDLQSYGLEQ